MVRVKLVTKYPLSYCVDREKVEVTADGKSGFVSVTSKPDVASDKFVIESDYVNVESEVAFGKKIPTDGLVFEFTMFEGAGAVLHDTSGNNNNGDIYGAVWKQLSTGKWVLSFDGKDDKVVVNSPSNLPTGSSSRTIIVWAKFYKEGRNQMIWWGKSSSNRGCGFRTTTTQYPEPVGFCFYFWANDLIVEYDYLTGTYLMCVARYNENENLQDIVVNTEVIGERTPKVPDTAYSDLIIGYRAVNDLMSGEIGAVYIYNRYLTDKELRRIYKATAPLFGIEV